MPILCPSARARTHCPRSPSQMIFADRHAGYSFDDRHTHAKQGFFYRKAGVPASQRPANGGWIYGGNVFPDGATASVFAGTEHTSTAVGIVVAGAFSIIGAALYLPAIRQEREASGAGDVEPATI